MRTACVVRTATPGFFHCQVRSLAVPSAQKRYALGYLAYRDRKSTRLNSSHANISYAVFCLKKNKTGIAVHPFFPTLPIALPVACALLCGHGLSPLLTAALLSPFTLNPCFPMGRDPLLTLAV